MLKLISSWYQRRRYLHEQSKIQSCGLYIVGNFGLALPYIGGSSTFPNDRILNNLSASMLDKEAVGASVIAALDYAATVKKPSIIEDYTLANSEFLDGMERHRKKIGIGKRKFESQMNLITISRMPGEITISKWNRRYGKFAFEGLSLAKNNSALPIEASNQEIGEAILVLRGYVA